jgi:hypothetical protein
MKGHRVRYTLATKLVNELVEAADKKVLTKTIAREASHYLWPALWNHLSHRPSVGPHTDFYRLAQNRARAEQGAAG